MFKRQVIIYALLVIIAFMAGIIYFLLKGKTEEPLPPQMPLEEILKTLTAPGAGQVDENVIKTLTAPKTKI